MRIAFVTLGYKPSRLSGLDVVGERLVDGLLAAGHSVTVFAGSIGTTREVCSHPGLDIQRIPLGKTDWFAYSYHVARSIHAAGQFDIIHFFDVHFAWAYRGKFVASLHQSFRQRMASLESRNGSLRSIYKAVYYHFARLTLEIPTLKKASGLLAVSATTRDEFIREYGIPSQKVILVYNGIDTDFFSYRPEATQLRQQLGLSPDQPVILFAGFITPRKGLEYLAQALPMISPRPVLLIVGRWRSSSYREQVMSLLEPYKELVVEVGFVPDEQMPIYLSLADVYVSSSLLEGFGLPIAEALACQTPVVAAQGGAVEEVIGPGGITVPPREPFALAQAISSLLRDPGLQRDLGEQGRRYVIQNFSLRRMIDSTLAAYDKFI